MIATFSGVPAGPSTITVLNASGSSFSCSRTVLNASGASFTITNAVLNASGSSFTVV